MNITDKYENQILDILKSGRALNQSDFRAIMDSAVDAIRELDLAEQEYAAEMELDMMRENKTITWILKHPARITTTKQIEVIRSTPTIQQALQEASRYRQRLMEGFNRSRVSHVSNHDYFSVIEMEEGSTSQEAVQAFYNDEGYVRKINVEKFVR